MEKVSTVPGFILKLWKMINDPSCDDLISWSDNGQSFIIVNPPKFSQELSKYFKHNNLSSFIRQLNMYGFRKVATIENSGLHPGTEDLHFYHPDFIRDHKERLEHIKRKLPQKITESVDLRNVYKGISAIEDGQKDVSKTLADIKRENEMLWAELHDLRLKHQQQQLYITRLMKLVFEAMEQNGIKTNLLQLRRNPPLMIEGGTTTTTATPITTNSTVDLSATTIANSPQQQQPTLITATSSPSPIDATTITLAGDAPNLIATNLYSTAAPSTSSFQVPATMDQELHFDHQLNNQSIETPTMDSPYQVSPPDVEAQIVNAEDQIDTLVPTIGDFPDEYMNLFE